MLYIFYGQDDFSLKEALTGLKQEIGVEELGPADVSILDGQRLSLSELVAICDALPFLSPRRLVIVEGLLARFEGDRRRGIVPQLSEWEGIKEYISRMPPSTVLALVDSISGRENPLLRQLLPKANVREFQPLKGTTLRNWVQSRVRGEGGDISPTALRLLTDLVGENLWILSNEIDKLCLYAQGRRIEEADVRLLVSQAREANIFAMVDAIVGRKLAVASRLLHQLLAEGAAPAYLLVMITRQFRLLVQAKELSPLGLPAAELAARIGLSAQYLLERVLEQARGYSLEQLKVIYHRLLDTDLAIKRGRLKGELAIELLLAELCQEG